MPEGCAAGSGQAQKATDCRAVVQTFACPLLSLDCCSITRRAAATEKASSVLLANSQPWGCASPLTDRSSFQPHISPGNCWAFRGSRGHALIWLPKKIQPTALTVWHVSKAVSPSGEVSSAPKEFAVLGVDEADGETLLGLFVYDLDGEIAQTFHVQQEEPRKAFSRVKLEVWSNWGNTEHTCVYRVEIHGDP
ncbi:SUN domain-containing protein 3-like isoform X1 [Lagopus leucura]|uniref:SUN domain-containing protein 3-like isoform X1 n=1 Tax=Lagopus leucura TaxID=30410 RepID=UPI001C6730D1|nr:SUN domain-containing protein 3-like isoform X1 [Lagopus leucura]